MTYDPKAPIRNGTAGEWRGPCFTFAEWLNDAVAPVWPEELWPQAVAVCMAEAGLVVPLRVGLRRVSTPMIWAGTVGDLDRTSHVWGPSYGGFQVRHLLVLPQPPVDPYGNSAAGFAKWQLQGWFAWGTHKSGAFRRWLPLAHRTIADRIEGRSGL